MRDGARRFFHKYDKRNLIKVNKIKEFIYKFQEKLGTSTNHFNWKIIQPNCPKQSSDGLDCGVFTAYAMKAAAKFTEPSLTAGEANAARLEIAARVHRGI